MTSDPPWKSIPSKDSTILLDASRQVSTDAHISRHFAKSFSFLVELEPDKRTQPLFRFLAHKLIHDHTVLFACSAGIPENTAISAGLAGGRTSNPEGIASARDLGTPAFFAFILEHDTDNELLKNQTFYVRTSLT